MAKPHSIAQAKYDSTHCKYYTLKMNLVNDADIIEQLEQVESKQGYIKQLIRQDIRTCSVPEKHNDSVPELFKDPYADTIAKAVGTWIDNATSILTDEKPYIVCDSVPKTKGENDGQEV